MTHYWIQITSGQGPEECEFAVWQVTKLILKEARQSNVYAEILEYTPGKKADTFLSTLISLEGSDLDSLINRWQGSVQWICKSIFRPHHKRKNWFVGVNFFKALEENDQYLDKKDIRLDTMPSSGPGGQHVNTTDSVVRAIHKPTGIMAVAREERSQALNKKLALARLASLLEQEKLKIIKDAQHGQWSKHTQLERGKPILTFTGNQFKEV